ncbi:unnamed protein product [Chilo suppressalis]|uniref:Uncharacterized protein n=1 Tax=Chilo suppressalis TaxID=168631 RepID=A0ABN8AZC7_CHISP|nr:unnamed protein product [Chilo suppressalis]
MMDLLTDSEELFEVNNVSLMEQSPDEESSAIIESITRHPSPDCTINHLDFDCDNQFCPWFIEKDISPPQSVDSTYTGLVYTPQANTPLSSFSEATLQTSRKRKNNPRKDKGNIRRRHVTEWKDNKRKILRNLGKAYKSRDGTFRCGKSLGPICHTKCRLQCLTKISNEEGIMIFNRFWDLGNRERQWAFIANLVVKQKKRRVFTDTHSRRNFTLIYRLTKIEAENQEIDLSVCKKMFLNTFSISEQFVYTSLEKKDSISGIVEADMRGRHSNHRKVITEDVIKSVCDHIKSLQPVESHYTRSRSNKLYLDGDLNFSRLFDLYHEWFNTLTYTSKASSERQYRDIVNEHFKISFHVPKKDQCDKCHIYKNISIPTLSETQLYEQHLNNKKKGRKQKLLDKELAKNSNGRLTVATFDFQKVLTAPYGNISVLYYKRKLSVFNFTVFDSAAQEGTCFMWHEGQGRRGANEVASCLFKYIAKYKDQGTREFRFWSDNIVGQNRNRILYAMYMHAAITFEVTIHHCFLEVGHTQNEGDSVHALIEKTVKNKLIYTPFEWYCLVRWAKQTGKPYVVEELQFTNFFNYKALLKGNWVKSTNGDKVQWNKIREVLIKPEDPYKLFYKYDLAADDYHVLCVRASTRRQCVSNVEALYETCLPIPKAKN